MATSNVEMMEIRFNVLRESVREEISRLSTPNMEHESVFLLHRVDVCLTHGMTAFQKFKAHWNELMTGPVPMKPKRRRRLILGKIGTTIIE